MRGQGSETTRSRILRVGFELFNSRGYGSTRVEEIARRARTSRATIYAHFSGKESLLAIGLEPIMAELEAIPNEADASEGTPADRLAYVLRRFVGLALENRERASVLLRLQGDTETGRLMNERRRQVEHGLIQMVADGVAAGQFRSDVDPALMTRLALSLSNWTTVWYRADCGVTPDDLADAVVGVALLGVSARGRVDRESARR